MAVGSCFIWIPFLLSCLCQVSGNTYVRPEMINLQGHLGNREVDDILSRIPITLPEGIDPNNINITSIIVKTCTGVEEQLARLNIQLQQTNQRNSQLNNEASGLRGEVRLLKRQLVTCSSTASASTGSHQTQLLGKMNQLLGTFDGDTFLIMKVIALTREVNLLQRKVKHAANGTERSQIGGLLREQQKKNLELTLKTQQLERSHTNAELILQIISLQDQIWALDQAELRRGDLQGLQEELDRKLSVLRDKRDADSEVLELISVHSKIAAIQRLIDIHIEESGTNSANYQRQLREKDELLKKTILRLNCDDSNRELTKEIMILQPEVENLRQLMMNAKHTTDSQLKELRIILEEEKEQEEHLQKQLKEAEHSQTQQIIKIISIIKEVRELDGAEQHQTTPTSQTTTLQTLLQAKERELAKTQAEINELQKKLRSKSKECSGLEERHEEVKAELEQKIAELNRTGDSEAALILNVINLHEDLRTLRDLISTTADPDKISELQRKLEEKQNKLKSNSADMERLVGNATLILTIIELQNEIWDLEKKAVNETDGGRVEELQNRLDGLISQISDDNINLMLKILTLQNQVERLQRQLSDLQTSQAEQVAKLTNDLTTKKNELQTNVNGLNEKNEKNAKLILQIAALHNQLRNIEKEKHDDNATSSLTITQLRERLQAKVVEHSRDQAELNALQNLLQDKEREHATAQAEVRELQKKLRSKSKECSGLEERHEEVKAELEQKIAELNRTGDSEAALILNVINLHEDLRTLRDLISTTDDPDRISELQKQLETKQDELNSRTAEIERLIPNPKIILTIIELQNEIWDLDRNETSGGRVEELQSRVNGLIGEIDANNTKLMLRIMTLQSQVERLQNFQTTQVSQLTNDLRTKKDELQKCVNELNEKNHANAQLILTTTDLQNQLRNLEKERHIEGQKTSAAVTKLKEELAANVEERSRDRAEINALQNKLNQTEAQCSSSEHKLNDLQNDLDAKMKELQSRTESVTSLALQVSTLTQQLEELKERLRNAESETKIKELQKMIDEKNNELTKKTAELKARSAQPQRFLQIIAIQTEIEKLVNVAANETNYDKIRALQDHLNYLIDGIQDKNNDNTKLMFKILAHKEEIARLKMQEKSQTQAALERIKDLEDELERVRNQIKEKTLVMNSGDTRIASLSAQIKELQKKIKPLEEEIADIKETSAENVRELQERLELMNSQLQDSELLLKDADVKNYNSIMEIADLTKQLKKAQKKAASKAAESNTDELEQQLQTQERMNQELKNTNKDLKQEVKELKMCCSNDVNSQCGDLQRQLQQSQEDANRLQQQLHEKDAALKQLQQELEEQTRENNRRQHEYNNLGKELQQIQDNADSLQQQLNEKDAALDRLQQELEEQTRKNENLQDDYDSLENEKNKLADSLQDLKNQIRDVEDKTIHARGATFDPNTAHPRIALSADYTEMSISDEVRDVADHLDRFDVALAVLGSTGFSSGRHYWEVSVAERLCYHLGMASESSPRKGTITFNPRNGFWTILLNRQGQYKAVDRRTVAIPVQIQPLTLGILLDYKRGEISFYDAGRRSHMYSFVGQTFTGEIYPFINGCVEDVKSQTPIVLLSPGSVDWIK